VHRAFHGHRASPGTFKARPGLMEVYGWKTEDEAKKHVKVYDQNYEEMLDDPDIEAVIIALPLWLHDAAAIKAMRKGKHVLTEKLMARTIARCKEMSRVAAKENMILATGHQRHYSILYDNAVDQIKRGLLGDLHHIRAQWHRGNLPGNDSWSPALPTKMLSQDEYIALRKATRAQGGEAAERKLRTGEYKLLDQYYSLQGALAKEKSASAAEDLQKRVDEVHAQLMDVNVDAAAHGYQAKTLASGYEVSPLEELIRWRLWDRTGAGLMAELGSHQLDAASIFVSSQRDDGEKVYPLSVQGYSMRSLFPQDREVDDHVHCNFEFPARGYYKDFASGEVNDPNRKIVVTYSSINGNGFGGYGEVVLGTKGTLILEMEKDALLFKGGDASSKIEVKDGKGGPALNTYETGGGAAAAVAQAATPKEVSRGYREEIEHWAWCIRNPSPENQPRCKPKVAMADAVIALTTNIAMREGRRIEFQKEWFDIDSDATPEGDKPRPLNEVG
ncbi:MAG: Gfo/Idh/MocA family oxidoreductase, partial [Planctomycetales bacterium]|nr:Gfo/Idh/MocA family oxidoreductase [Planctomycetales bacterium]